nr:auxilin-like protein [Tanacetum cinerariifolium]
GFTNKDTVPSKAQQTLTNVIFSETVKDIKVHFDIFDMTMRQTIVFECLRAPHAQDFLLAISIDGLGQHMSPVKYRRLSSRGFTAGQAALKAASGKVTKHEKACIENQHVFIPFAFNTFGFLAADAVELLSRVQRVMHINVITPRSTDVLPNPLDKTLLSRRLLPLNGSIAWIDVFKNSKDVNGEKTDKCVLNGSNRVLSRETGLMRRSYDSVNCKWKNIIRLKDEEVQKVRSISRDKGKNMGSSSASRVASSAASDPSFVDTLLGNSPKLQRRYFRQGRSRPLRNYE